MRNIEFRKNATKNLSKKRPDKQITKERVEDVVKVFEMNYGTFDGETAIKFFHAKRFCFVVVECYPDTIFIKVISCSKSWEQKMNHIK